METPGSRSKRPRPPAGAYTRQLIMEPDGMRGTPMPDNAWRRTFHDGRSSLASGSFRVEEFRVPLVDARVVPPKGPLVASGALAST